MEWRRAYEEVFVQEGAGNTYGTCWLRIVSKMKLHFGGPHDVCYLRLLNSLLVTAHGEDDICMDML